MANKRTLKLGYIAEQLRPLAVKIGDLTPDTRNARVHTEDNRKRVRDSLNEFGQRKPIIVQRRGDVLVIRAGNCTTDEARKLGWTHVAAVVLEEEDDRARAYALADNRSPEGSYWDVDVLNELTKEMSVDLVAKAGFTSEDLGKLLSSLEPDELPTFKDVDESIEEQVTWNECPECGHKWPLR